MSDDFFIELPEPAKNTLIKVIGVGGGGGNAVANMLREDMYDVSLLVCNSDSKALADSPVVDKLQIGPGLGCGGRPEMGKSLAEEHLADIYDAIDPETKMVFITAGMGGGTGTGAAPVIARETKARNILTVGVVTLPFLFEGKRNIDKALDGMEAMAREVDSLLIVNNERMLSVYSTSSVIDGFKMADKVLTLAVKSIVDIIKMRGVINLDFQDVCMVLRKGGISVISTGYARGEKRIEAAINNALNSPLLNNNDIYNAKRLVMCLTFSEAHEALMMDELQEVNDFIDKFHHKDMESKWGLATDASLKDEVKVTILASDFKPLDSDSQESEADLLIRMAREERYNKYYKKSTDPALKRHNTPIYIYDLNDLDNELLIHNVDTFPTANRTREQLIKFRAFQNQ